ncbi:MAG: GNAT family N-acetyltransferase [Flavobacteriaceae bacterium]|nr:GNAT family N-acetyltransferase [Flavobacteriaceae bacterium]
MPDNIIFETTRLIIRCFKHSDASAFFDMMGNPNVMNPIPLTALSQKKSDEKLQELINYYTSNSIKNIWAIDQKTNSEMVGLCGLIHNNDGENEIAYRFREKFWNLGYGTEIAKGLIDYGFEKLNFELVTADAYLLNKKSIKIIEKFMFFDKEFYNQKDNCIDQRYKLTKIKWMQNRN